MPPNSAQSRGREPASLTVRVWEYGRPREVSYNELAATVDIVRPNGDVLQMVLNQDGDVLIRAWKRADLHENGGQNRTILDVSGRPFGD